MRWCRSQKPAKSTASVFPIAAGCHPAVPSHNGAPCRKFEWNFSRCYGLVAVRAEEKAMSVGTIILIILIIALLGGFSGIGGGPFYGTGYYGGGGLGVVIVILLILVLMGRI
jgi:Protein of unknown function (DUF3309)